MIDRNSAGVGRRVPCWILDSPASSSSAAVRRCGVSRLPPPLALTLGKWSEGFGRVSGSVTAWERRQRALPLLSDTSFAGDNKAGLFAMELHRRKISKLFSDPDLFS